MELTLLPLPTSPVARQNRMLFVNLVTAVEEQGQNEFVYPSPFTDVLNVSENATLLDATGKTIRNLSKGENDVSQLSHGLYLVVS